MDPKPYPLFDELLSKVSQKIDVPIDIKRVCTTINTLSQTMSSDQSYVHYYEIAGLIYHYSIVHHHFNFTIPYDGKLMTGGKGILYFIANLPPLLQQIISQYIEDFSQP